MLDDLDDARQLRSKGARNRRAPLECIGLLAREVLPDVTSVTDRALEQDQSEGEVVNLLVVLVSIENCEKYDHRSQRDHLN